MATTTPTQAVTITSMAMTWKVSDSPFTDITAELAEALHLQDYLPPTQMDLPLLNSDCSAALPCQPHERLDSEGLPLA